MSDFTAWQWTTLASVWLMLVAYWWQMGKLCRLQRESENEARRQALAELMQIRKYLHVISEYSQALAGWPPAKKPEG
jgi:hypothetical protein